MKNIIYLIIICSISSCATFSKSSFKKEYSQLEKTSLNKLNGTYHLYPTKRFGRQKESKDPIKHANLFKELTGIVWKETDDLSIKHYSLNSYFVKLSFINKTTLSLKLFENDAMINEETIKGKLKNGMFNLDNKRKECRGVPYVFGGCYSDKRRIGITKTGRLIVNTAVDNTGAMLLVLAAGHSYNSSFEYAKIQ